ncbi:fructose 1,6-bisphosphate aldolase/phosphatase [Thermodesulfobium acidiphilum]|uniref:Fructose-1,6-bisphosphate aldolase/phosphatase n=1 Tax=Thermodesulfobium acidiphilum TaxID=1794699 RepID=A0A2R4VZE4_THEAF|nr:fructose 1,6-bisphosphatase [Thermodesulfobium acidiphilum]AWB09824.1 fructose 1,6-bisphosphate aldolase/phosphatase [Thermodesulfobium acidiphilum]
MKIRLDMAKFDVSGYVDNISVHPIIVEKLECFFSNLVSEKEILDYNVLTLSNRVLVIVVSEAERFKEANDIDKILYGALGSIEKADFNFTFENSSLKQFKNFLFTERRNESILIFFSTNVELVTYNMAILKLLFNPFANFDIFKINVFELYTINLKFNERLKSYTQFKDLFKLLKDIKKSSLKFFVQSIEGQNSEPVMVSLEDSSASIWRVSTPYFSINFILNALVENILPVTFYDSSNALAFPKSLAVGFTLQNGKLFGPVDLFDDSFYDSLRSKFYEKIINRRFS